MNVRDSLVGTHSVKFLGKKKKNRQKDTHICQERGDSGVNLSGRDTKSESVES